MQRRSFLAGPACALIAAGRLPADERQEFTDWLGRWVAHLSEENSGGFLRAFDRQMPGRGELERNIIALLRGWEVSSSVRIQRFDGQTGEAQLDWFLQLNPRTPAGATERRRETVRLKFVKQKKGWRIVDLDPLSFLRLPE
jgi:hypothetical protein